MTVPVRDASTVILLRDGVTALQAWLLTRVEGMAFAGGMTVFPGGRVDPADADVPWAGLPAAEFAAAFDCDEVRARALVVAAVRETFEETGVLLTVPPASLPAEREAVELGTLAFADLLRSRGLAIDASALRPWSRWITPEGEVRRYDTHFFVAAMPSAAVADATTTEASVAEWVTVTHAIAMGERGERVLMPPTRSMLHSLARFETVAEVLAGAAGRPLQPVRPLLRPALQPPDATLVPVRSSTLP